MVAKTVFTMTNLQYKNQLTMPHFESYLDRIAESNKGYYKLIKCISFCYRDMWELSPTNLQVFASVFGLKVLKAT